MLYSFFFPLNCPFPPLSLVSCRVDAFSSGFTLFLWKLCCCQKTTQFCSCPGYVLSSLGLLVYALACFRWDWQGNVSLSSFAVAVVLFLFFFFSPQHVSWSRQMGDSEGKATKASERPELLQRFVQRDRLSLEVKLILETPTNHGLAWQGDNGLSSSGTARGAPW